MYIFAIIFFFFFHQIIEQREKMQIVVSLIDAVFDRIKPITLPDRHVQPVVTVRSCFS